MHFALDIIEVQTERSMQCYVVLKQYGLRERDNEIDEEKSRLIERFLAFRWEGDEKRATKIMKMQGKGEREREMHVRTKRDGERECIRRMADKGLQKEGEREKANNAANCVRKYSSFQI